MLPDEGYESGSDSDMEISEEEEDEEFWDAIYEDLVDGSENLNTNQPH